MAEVMKFEDFKEFGNENAVKVSKEFEQENIDYRNHSRLKENIDNKEKIIPLKMEISFILK